MNNQPDHHANHLEFEEPARANPAAMVAETWSAESESAEPGSLEPESVAAGSEEVSDSSDAAEIDAASEETAGDCFITYTRKLTLPAVTISAAGCLLTRVPDLGRLRITNNSNFSYSISLARVPDWLTVEPTQQSLEPGEEASFALGIDQGNLPPGPIKNICELVMRRPFINRAYAFEVNIEVEYVTPAPRIEVVGQSGKGINTLRIAVRNAGGGLLQGYYYDRNRNERKSFLLAGDSPRAERRQQEGNPARQTTHTNRLFEIERNFQDLEEVSRGFLIVCDCINEKFRQFEISPETYFKPEALADLPLIDFMQVEAGRNHEREIEIRHPAFREGCSVTIPTRLRRYVQHTQLARGRIRFAVSNQAGKLGSVADQVEFKSSGGLQLKLPIIISFKEAD